MMRNASRAKRVDMETNFQSLDEDERIVASLGTAGLFDSHKCVAGAPQCCGRTAPEPAPRFRSGLRSTLCRSNSRTEESHRWSTLVWENVDIPARLDLCYNTDMSSALNSTGSTSASTTAPQADESATGVPVNLEPADLKKDASS